MLPCNFCTNFFDDILYDAATRFNLCMISHLLNKSSMKEGKGNSNNHLVLQACTPFQESSIKNLVVFPRLSKEKHGMEFVYNQHIQHFFVEYDM